MKFLIDAQLPMRLARILQLAGYDTIHTLNLPQKNATPDTEINSISISNNRIVITKDRDFMDSFLIQQKPYKLLLITTGNISNNELMNLFTDNLSEIVELFEQYSFIEMSRNAIIIH
jgi:predicted nuclease of predicted toxin-antitoxin system